MDLTFETDTENQKQINLEVKKSCQNSSTLEIDTDNQAEIQ